MNRKSLALIVLSLVFSVILFLKRESPFGLIFFIALNLFILSLIGLLFFLGRHLYHKKSPLLKLISFIPFLFSGMLLLTYILVTIDYRILLPITSANSLSPSELAQDLDFLKTTLRGHPAYDTHVDSIVSIKMNRLLLNTDLINRDQFITELMGIIGLFKDGHSYLPPIQVYNRSRYFPLVCHYFEDGLYILNASDAYSELKNKKLLKINSTAIDSIVANINELSGPENIWNAKSRLNLYLFSANTLKGLNIIPDDRQAIITFREKDGNETSVEISSAPFFNWLFWAFKPTVNVLPIGNNIRKPNFTLQKRNAELHLTINLIEDISDQETLSNLAEEMDTLLKTKIIQRVILDLRSNLGGNNQLYKPIITTIKRHPEINHPDHLFILISRTTFSAGVNFVDDLRFETRATLVGEPTGAGATHYGDATFYKLPNSGVFFFLSTKQWISRDTTDQESAIIPDIPIQFYFKDYIQNKDPWFKEIASFVENN